VADGVRMMVVPGSAAGARRPRPRACTRSSSGGRGVALRRLLDVPGHEPGHAQARPALGVHVEPQLRGPAGPGRAHPSGCRRRSPPPPPSSGASPRRQISRSTQWRSSPSTPERQCR
jgi:hypothetical protein